MKPNKPMRANISVKDLITGIRHDIVAARNHFEVYRIYMLKETRDKYHEVLRVSGYAGFFPFDLAAHFAAMIVTLGRIFDSNPKCIGIPALLEASPTLKDIASDYEHACALWHDEKIMVLRHQVVAHRYSAASVGEIFRRIKPSLNKFQ